MENNIPGQTPGNPRRRSTIKLATAGLVTGGAIGFVLAWNRRQPEASSPAAATPEMVDWNQVRQIATSINQADALTITERAKLDHEYQQLVARAIPIVAEYIDVEMPPDREQIYAFDRVDWVNANIDAFQVMLKPLETLYGNANGSKSVAANLWGGVSRNIVSAELGVLLGYLARRVLGQYDIAILGREPVESGKLFFVEPNIQMVSRNLRVPIDELRLWLALHETTHAFQFEAFPWVRPHFNQLLERYFEFLKGDIEELGKGLSSIRLYANRLRSQQERDSWLEALMTPEQHALYEEMQALMCVIEGYSNHVMNATGKQVMPNFDEIRRKFERRQQQRSKAEQLFARFTGLDIKMEQYRLGQAFVDQVVEQRGHDFARLVWEHPANLPTLAEIKQPADWITRMDEKSQILKHQG